MSDHDKKIETIAERVTGPKINPPLTRKGWLVPASATANAVSILRGAASLTRQVVSYVGRPRVMAPLSMLLFATVTHVAIAYFSGKIASNLMLMGVGGDQISAFGGGGGGGGSCAQSSAWIARMSGLGSTEKTAYDGFICGLVSDGIIDGSMTGSTTGATGCGSVIDIMYPLAIDTAPHALANMCNTSFTATANNSPTFTPDVGYAGNGVNAYIDSNWTASSDGLAYQLTAAFTAACISASRTTPANTSIWGAVSGSGSAYNFLTPVGTSPNNFEVNGFAFPTFSNSDALGFYLTTRESVNSLKLYKSSSNLSSTGGGVGGVPTRTMLMLAFNDTGGPSLFATDTMALFMAGGSINSTQEALITARVHTLTVALGISGC